MSKHRDLYAVVISRTCNEWGYSQATLIERCFEFLAEYNSPAWELSNIYRGDRPRDLLLAICKNIVANHGEFKPETSL